MYRYNYSNDNGNDEISFYSSYYVFSLHTYIISLESCENKCKCMCLSGLFFLALQRMPQGNTSQLLVRIC